MNLEVDNNGLDSTRAVYTQFNLAQQYWHTFKASLKEYRVGSFSNSW